MEVLVKRIILAQLQKLFPNITRQQLTLHLSKGHFKIENVPIPPTLDILPSLRFKHGNIGLVEIMLNWTQLLRSPIQIEVSNVELTMEAEQHNFREELRNLQTNLESEVENLVTEPKRDSKSLLQKLAEIVADNLEVRVKNINVTIKGVYGLGDFTIHLDQLTLKKDNQMKIFQISSFVFSIKDHRLEEKIERYDFSFSDINFFLNYQNETQFELDFILLQLQITQTDRLRMKYTICDISNLVENVNGMKRVTDNAMKIKISKVDQIIKVSGQLGGGVIEWRTNSIYQIQSLIQQIIQANRSQQSQSSGDVLHLSEEHIEIPNYDRVSVQLLIGSLKIVFINQGIRLGVIKGENGYCNMFIRKWDVEVDSGGELVEYQECTNYPHTVECNDGMNDYGFPMISNVCNIKLLLNIFDNDCPANMIIDSLYNFVRIEAQDVRLQYMQQPFLRFLDFLFEQFINLVTNDYGVDSKTRKTNEQIRNTILNPKFTDIQLIFTQSEVFCCPIPYQSEEQFKITIDQLKITTQPSRTSVRIAEDESFLINLHSTRDNSQMIIDSVWELLLFIEADNAQVFLVDDTKIIRQITTPIDIKVQFAKPLFSYEYDQYIKVQYAFNFFLKKLDKKQDVTMFIQQVKVQLTRFDYLMLMKVLFNNILYDDERDCAFIYNYSPLNKTNPSRIRFQIQVLNANIDIIDQSQEFLNKLITLEFNDLRLKYLRNSDATSSLEISVDDLYADQWNPFEFQYTVTGIINRNILQQSIFPMKYFESQNKEILLGHEGTHFQIQSDKQFHYLQRNTTTDKQIFINAKNLEVALNLQWLFTLINFFFVDDSCYIIQVPTQLKPIILQAAVQSALVVLHCPDLKNYMVVQGDIFFAFQKNSEVDAHEHFHELNPVDSNTIESAYQISYSDCQRYDDSDDIPNEDNSNQKKLIQTAPRSKLKIESGNIRLSSWEAQEGFNKKNFDQTRRREIFNGVQVQWKSESFTCACIPKHRQFNEQYLIVDKFTAQLTLNELNIIIKTVAYLKDSIISVQSGQEHFEFINMQYQLSSTSRRLFSIEQAQILVLNGSDMSFAPLLFCELGCTPLMIEQRFSKFILTGSIHVALSFYNMTCGQFEPILEKVTVELAFIRNAQSYPRTSLSIEIPANTQVNIVLHWQFLKILKKTLQKIKDKRQQDFSLKLTKSVSSVKRRSIFEKQISHISSEEKVTLLQIENYSGYCLKLRQKNEIFTVENNNKISYTSNFDNEQLMNSFSQALNVNVEFNNLKNERTVLQNVLLESYSGRTQEWFRYDIEKQLHQVQGHNFLVQSYVSDVGRVFLITSPLLLLNRTQFDIEVVISNSKQEWNSPPLIRGEKQGVPVELIVNTKPYIRFGFSDPQFIKTMSEPRALIQSSYQEIQHGIYFTTISLEADQLVTKRQTLLFDSPFTFFNCLPHIINIIFSPEITETIHNQIDQSGTISLGTQANFQLHTCRSTDLLQLQFHVNGLKSELFIIGNQPETKQIKLYSTKSEYTRVFIKTTRQNSSWKVYFYAQTNLQYYTLNHSVIQKLPRQIDERVLLMDDQPNLMLRLTHDEEAQTHEVQIKGVGETSLELKSKKQANSYQLIEFALYITLKCTVPELGLYSKIIELAPRYVIINETQFYLEIQQEGAYGQPQNVKQSERMELIWSDCRKEKLIVIRVFDKQVSWSGSIYLAELRTVNFYCTKKTDKYARIFFKAIITKNKSTFYITIIHVEEGQYAYKIANNTQYSIYYTQKSSSDLMAQAELHLQQSSITPFAWPYPSLDPILVVKINTIQQPRQTVTVSINLFKFEERLTVQIGDSTVLVGFRYENQTKVIEFREKVQSLDQDFPQNQTVSQLNKVIYVKIPVLTISLISCSPQTMELNLISFFEVEICTQDQENDSEYQMRIRFIQIDQNYPLDCANPVNLTPKLYRALFSQQGQKKYVINLFCRKKKRHDQFIIIESLKLEVLPLVIKIDENYIQMLLEYIRYFFEEENSTRNIIQRDQILSSYEVSKLMFMSQAKRDPIIKLLRDQYQVNNPFYEWQIVKVPAQTTTLYIQDMVLQPIQINFGFQKSFNSNQEGFFLFRMLANALGTAISNIEDAPILLYGFRTENLYDSTGGILMQLGEHYKFALAKQILKVLGSIDLIGNPLSFLSRISTGLQDFIEKPIEGISKGPLELGLGIIEGASSLIKNTIAGAFYSVNKVTGGIATQLSMLTMDESYLQQRRKFLSRKPKQFFEGLYQGIYSILYGVGDGIIGIVQQPYIHGKDQGIGGVLKGCAIGTTGMIIKPITGVFDAAAKTAEGFTNTATAFDDKPNNERVRNVRTFYSLKLYTKPYSANDALIMHRLQSLRAGKYSGINLIDTFQLNDIESGEMILLLSHQVILYLSKSGWIKFEVESRQIRKFRLLLDPNRPDRQIINFVFLKKLQNQQIVEEQFQAQFQKIPYSQILSNELNQLIEQK